MVDGAASSDSGRVDSKAALRPLQSLELVRLAVAPEGAFGVLMRDELPTGLVTLERTYPVDELRPRGIQYVKIPAGRYRCERTYFNRGGYYTFEVRGVVGHDRLLFHRGNTEGDSEGCILLGQRFGFLKAGPGVLDSCLAFAVFMRLTAEWSNFDLIVRGAFA